MNKEVLIAAGRAALDVLLQYNVDQQERDYAFLAGLLESGCLTITKNPPNKGYPDADHTYNPLIAFGSQSEDLATWAQTRFKGTKIKQPPRGVEWRLTGVLAIDVIRRCQPYIIGKARHVQLLIDLQNAKNVNTAERGPQRRIYEEMKALNKRAPLQPAAKTKNA